MWHMRGRLQCAKALGTRWQKLCWQECSHLHSRPSHRCLCSGWRIEKNKILIKFAFFHLILLNQKLTAEHLGYFEFRICNVDGWNKEATQECLDQTILKDQSGKSKFYVNMSFKYYYKLVLPAGLKCNHCVFQVIRIIFTSSQSKF